MVSFGVGVVLYIEIYMAFHFTTIPPLFAC